MVRPRLALFLGSSRPLHRLRRQSSVPALHTATLSVKATVPAGFGCRKQGQLDESERPSLHAHPCEAEVHADHVSTCLIPSTSGEDEQLAANARQLWRPQAAGSRQRQMKGAPRPGTAEVFFRSRCACRPVSFHHSKAALSFSSRPASYQPVKSPMMPLADSSPLNYSNSGPGMIAGCITLAFISTLVVISRFWARRLTHQSFALDDYLCLAALIIQHGLLAAGGVMILQGGLGRDIRITAAENPDSTIRLFQGLFAGEIIYTYSSPLIKLSVLAFYWRVFPTPRVRQACKILGALSIIWCIIITTLDFVQCRPLRAFWHIELQALPTTHCLDSSLCFLANSLANCVIDFLTLILPIQEIVKLQMSTRRKITVGCVFLLGSIAFAASLVRTISTGIMIRDGVTNFSLQFVASGTATVVEIYVAIIGACMPTLVPVYRQLRYGTPTRLKAQSGPLPRQTLANRGRNGKGSMEILRAVDNYDCNHPVAVNHDHLARPLGYTKGESYEMDSVAGTQNIV